MKTQNIFRIPAVFLMLVALAFGNGCNNSDTVVNPLVEDPPTDPPTVTPNYSGTFAISGVAPDMCGEGVVLPIFFEVTVAGDRFILVGLLKGAPAVFANGSFDAGSRRGYGHGDQWSENRAGRPPGTICPASFGLGADLTFTNEDDFRGTVWFERRIHRQEQCMVSPCRSTWSIRGTRI